jgi:hypothetical protein
MALPNRKGVVYVYLADPDRYPQGQSVLNDTVFGDEQKTYTPPDSPPRPPKQGDFYSYREFFPGYPPGLVVKVASNIPINGHFIQFEYKVDIEIKYPTGAEVAYNPTPPPDGPGQLPPDPNGETATYEEDVPWLNLFITPRYFTDEPFSFSSGANYDWYAGSVVPLKDNSYLASSEGTGAPRSPITWEATVENLLTRVLNLETDEYEEYPYKQATTDLKVNVKVRPKKIDNNICCWNKGTVINGKMAIWTIDLTTRTNPETGYFWAGMWYDTGSTFSPNTELDWSVTIDEGFTPAEIEIPRIAGKAAFINDIWITSVTPPGPPA